ncbi:MULTISPECIES: hypothetical protein [Prochlorococcus]|uniref:hypothetical protein n=1 Tax=Prochlorococcus TaxID=1218 RepID=UPI000533738E|nr:MULTISPECIES: hypothetical protein [Prochlorococcus]KGG13282.1 hypothetical protein EV05_0961 [Prochlorococcus sp. MIT 0601]
MNKSAGLLPIAIILLFLLPTPAGKFLFDLAGSLILLSLFIPILLTIIGWIGWKVIKSRMIQCNSCGTTYPSNLYQCPICGSEQVNEISDNNKETNSPASSATIDIEAEESD